MKDIKFRVWLPDGLGNKMEYNPYLGRAQADKIFNKYWMQYTGLKDKNDKEIYENDIVLDHTEYADLWPVEGIIKDNRVIAPLKVYWSKKEAQFILLGDFHPEDWYFQYSDQIHDRKLEIIGNVYENPELLRKNV